MKGKIARICLFIIGISIILYPFISKVVALCNQTIAISKYSSIVTTMTNDEKEKQKEITDNYNKSLYDNTEIEIEIYETSENATSYVNFLNIGDIIGYVKIPKIHVD